MLSYGADIPTFGSNSYGQLGRDGSSAPAKVVEKNLTYDISAGKYHTLATDADHNVYAWGRNLYGELGVGSLDAKSTPVRVDYFHANGKKIDTISAGDGYTVASDREGNIYGFGDYAHGKALDINETRSTWPVRIGERRHLLAETEITLKVGESLQLNSFSGNDFNLYEDIAANAGKEFKSANDAVAEISEGGLVTGRKRGITNVYVKSGSMINSRRYFCNWCTNFIRTTCNS